MTDNGLFGSPWAQIILQRRRVGQAPELPTSSVASPGLPPMPTRQVGFPQAPQMLPDPTETPYAALGTAPQQQNRGFTPTPLPQMPQRDVRGEGVRSGRGALVATALGALLGGAQGGAAAGQGYMGGADQQAQSAWEAATQKWRADAAGVQDANQNAYRAYSDQQDQGRFDQQMALREQQLADGRAATAAAAAERLALHKEKLQREALMDARAEVEAAMARGDAEMARNLQANAQAVTGLLSLYKSYQEIALSPIDPKVTPQMRQHAADAMRQIAPQLERLGFRGQVVKPSADVLASPQINPLDAKKLAAQEAAAKAKREADAAKARRQAVRDARADARADENLGLSRERLGLSKRADTRAEFSLRNPKVEKSNPLTVTSKIADLTGQRGQLVDEMGQVQQILNDGQYTDKDGTVVKLTPALELAYRRTLASRRNTLKAVEAALAEARKAMGKGVRPVEPYVPPGAGR